MRHNAHSYTRVTESHPAASLSEALFYEDDVLPELQSALATLADLEVQFEIARDCLEEWCGLEEDKQRCCAELAQAHQQAREVHLQRLARLQERVKANCSPH